MVVKRSQKGRYQNGRPRLSGQHRPDTVRPSAHPQTHEPGRSRRQPDPSPQSLFRTLQTSFPPHVRENTAPPYTVKKIQKLPRALPVKCGFHATDVSKEGNQTAGWTRISTVDSLNDWFTKVTASPFPPCSGCDIVRSGCEGASRADAGFMRMSAE